jgi:HMG (high mobility group) box
MSAHRSIRKSVPFASNPIADPMFYNYSPPMPLLYHQKSNCSPLVDDTELRSPDFVWEAEYQDKMPVLESSISQVPSSERRQINFQFIDDMKATFDFKSMHSKKKRSTGKQGVAEPKAAPKKDRKNAIKLPDNNKKRRPRNAFILYRTVLQAKAEFKGKTQTELSRLIAHCWQKEPPETRARFERAAELEKGTYITDRVMVNSS